MIYLDYSAATPVDKEILDRFVEVSTNYPANPNSKHKLGLAAKKIIDDCTNNIASLLNIKPNEIIYTSGASESNNLAIKGICEANPGKHIITTRFEHSSVTGPIGYLQRKGYDVDFVKSDKYGRVDIDDLKRLLRDDTVLVSITAVNSEIGIIEPIEQIGKLLKEYPNCYFHVDLTQGITKLDFNLENIDLAVFTPQKLYGIRGIGILIKKENIKLEPLIHGGASTTVYRSGTPTPALIASFELALEKGIKNRIKNYNYVLDLNKYLREELKKYNRVRINSDEQALPYILNISIIGYKPQDVQHALELEDIYISTQTACSLNNSVSASVLSLTNDQERAKSSVRISLSPITTKKELEEFIVKFDKVYNELGEKYENN